VKACWCHDVIEDARQSYNDVQKKVGEAVANIVYACTNLRGKTREERAPAEYYKLIRETPYADFVKICDRLANSLYSAFSQSKMLDKYRLEQAKFKAELYKPEYIEMFDKLSNLLSK